MMLLLDESVRKTSVTTDLFTRLEASETPRISLLLHLSLG